MLELVTGDLLADESDALVNAVNTAGVMGKGIALQFKTRWPDMFRSYRNACTTGDLQPGRLHVWSTNSNAPRWIINFPTKRHWRSPSRLEDIDLGFSALTTAIREYDVKSLALPLLGCGLGGLDRADVEPLIHHHLSPLASGVDIRIYQPPAT
jgi:O-acetyl-ADP-ribose deacetylase (regulator of RNase III)